MKSNSSSNTYRPNLATSGEKGFSLLELLIAMVIFLIVTASIYGLMQLGSLDRNRASRRSDALKNARVAVHVIGRDVLNAGLGYHRRGALVPDNLISTRLALPLAADSSRDLLTSILAGNNLNTNVLNPDTNARTDTIAFAYRDVDFNAGSTITLQGSAAASGSPTVTRLTASTATGAAAAQPFDLFLIESDKTQSAVMATAVNGSNTIDAAPGDPLGLNQALDGTGIDGTLLRICSSSADTNCMTYPATAKRVFVVSYKVKYDGTLVRIVYGNNRGAAASAQIQEYPMAYNVEDFQIRYVLDDGSLSDNPSVGADGIVGTLDDDWQGFNRIRQLTVKITVQATEIDEKTNKPEMITFSSTFSTRNLGYDAG